MTSTEAPRDPVTYSSLLDEIAGSIPAELEPEPATLRSFARLCARIIQASEAPLSWHSYGKQVTPDRSEQHDLLLVHIPSRASSIATRRVLLNGGTHGDEPAGVEALVRFVEERHFDRWPEVEFFIIPCANPWGYVHNRREGPCGIDLNRCFQFLHSTHRRDSLFPQGDVKPSGDGRMAAPLEVTLFQEILQRCSFDLVVDCHEDVDASGFYVFAPPSLGRAVVAAVGQIGPLHVGAIVDNEFPLRGSVVELSLSAERHHRAAGPLPLPLGSLASALLLDGLGSVATTVATAETPTTLPLEDRVTMHLVAIHTALCVTQSEK